MTKNLLSLSKSIAVSTGIAMVVMFYLVPVVQAQQTSSVIEELSEAGLALQVDQPEGAILAVSLPDVYILPDSFLYWIVEFWEEVQYVLTEDSDERVELMFTFAEKRLAETIKLIEKDRADFAALTIERYQNELDAAMDIVDSLPQKDRAAGLSRISEQAWYQKAFMRIMQADGISDLFFSSGARVGESSEIPGIELQSL